MSRKENVGQTDRVRCISFEDVEGPLAITSLCGRNGYHREIRVVTEDPAAYAAIVRAGGWGDSEALCFDCRTVLWVTYPPGSRCRSHDEYSGEPCPECGFVRVPLPEWIAWRSGVVFALDGRVYRTVTAGGSSNRRTRLNMHSQECVHAVELDEDEDLYKLPDAPATKAEVGQVLDRIFKESKVIYAVDLARALHLERKDV